MSPVATLLAVLAMVSGEPPLANSWRGEETRGPLRASLTVSSSAEAKGDIVLRVVLRNVSNQRQSFFLERPGVAFYVKGGRGVAHASAPCLQIGTCKAGLHELTTLGPGEQMEFVEYWRPHGGCSRAGSYSVEAKLRAYQERRPDGTVDVGSFVPFTLLTDILVRREGEPGRCVIGRAGSPGPDGTSNEAIAAQKASVNPIGGIRNPAPGAVELPGVGEWKMRGIAQPMRPPTAEPIRMSVR
jgi:hypothetical protein